jgi:hypothetical protein
VEIEVGGCGGCEERRKRRGYETVVGGVIRGEYSSAEHFPVPPHLLGKLPRIHRCSMVFLNEREHPQWLWSHLPGGCKCVLSAN